ncbi:valine--tRNA ligase [Pseudahrensia aquimaris]|uniref:Valine--tRNA ligase n=1 Tax=Pseudahrensia aquimaris TaxID=744461 RepID=A0ABW3FG41_9HYPH
MLEKIYDAASVEPRIAKKWDEANAFAAGAGAKPGAEPFCIVIPPPNVTGSLHMGHALNNTLQDILCRFERMRGKDVLWQPGMDHAGIATQMVVERQLMERQQPGRREMGREAFVEKVWEWKEESGGTIFNQLKRLGASCDWSRERFTMDEGLSEAVLEVFVKLYNEGLIYRGKRLVNWDPHFETAISDLEVENIEVDGHMWHFKYPLADGATYEYVEKDEDGNVTLRETRDYISIATTRPETMLGDGAVAVHPSDERYAPIVGKLCEIPVGPKEHRRLIPIITDEYPDPEFGSGAVKITGAHDFNDYQVAKRNNIPMYRLMDTKAAMRADGAPYAEEAAKANALVSQGGEPDENYVDAINLVPEEYRGLDRYDAREKVVADITAEGLAVMVLDEEGNQVPLVENNKLQAPYGDRSKVVIEPMLTDQWFCDAETLAQPALASVKEGRTNFVPKTWENTYYNWMENIQPWCISRQLWWGHRIPAWFDQDGNIFVAKSEDEAQKIAGAAVELERDPDVLDTWFSSALWPFSTLGWPEQTPELAKYYQTDVLVTGFDIIFFWVARMMMMGDHFMKDADGKPIEPFHTVYVHALVRDKDGQKMSKSKGNVIDPLDLMDEYGTDALRFTLAIMAAQGRDVRLDTARIAGYRNFGTKLWNATRFAQMNEAAWTDFDVRESKQQLNRWILTEFGKAVDEVTEAIEKLRFNDAAAAAYRFTWNTFCDWYLELLKPVFGGEDEAAKAESQAVAAHVLDGIYKLLHPFMPFMTEELWASTASRDSLLCHADWPSAELRDDAAADEINWLIDLVSQVRSVRSEMNIKPSLQMQLEVVNASEETKARLARNDGAIKRLARLETVALADAAPQGAAQIVVGEATLCLPLDGVVDFAAEKARLEKELAGLDKDIKQISGKLANEKFVANAPDAVVQENRDRLSDATGKREKVAEALERIAGLA